MAVRLPLAAQPVDGDTAGLQIFEMATAGVDNIHKFATYAYAQDPSVNLEVDTANGTLLSGQPFVDTYYVAGAYSTRIDRYATEAETANIVLTTDNYNRLRYVLDSVTLPTGDTNDTQYPLYLYNAQGSYGGENPNNPNTHFRCMTRQDFIDTFVLPALSMMDSDGFYNGTNNIEQNGTYFLTTTNAPTNATVVSNTPVAINSEANAGAYQAAQIPEAVKQTVDVNYYIAKVDFPATSYAIYDAVLGTYDLPLYFNSGDEMIYQHTPTTWSNLIGPFLRYYFGTAGSGYDYTYSLSGGTQKGTTYVDTRLTNSSTYEQRFVNADDYRTQEFPNGTQTTISANQQILYINRAGTPSYGASSNPSGSVSEGASVTFTLTTTNVLDGTSFNYAITGITAADITSGSLTGTVTTSSGAASTSITLKVDGLTESETATCTFTTPGGDRSVAVTVTDVAESVSLEGTTSTAHSTGHLPLSDGSIDMGWRFNSDGTIDDWDEDATPQFSGGRNTVTHLDWCNVLPPTGTYYIRATEYASSTGGNHSWTNSTHNLNTWYQLNVNRLWNFEDNSVTASYVGRSVTLKIDIATDSGGSNIVATGYYMSFYEGGA